MAVTGKTGADAISKDYKHIVRLIAKYGPKLSAVISAAQAAGAITSDEATTINACISGAVNSAVCFAKLAQYSGF